MVVILFDRHFIEDGVLLFESVVFQEILRLYYVRFTHFYSQRVFWTIVIRSGHNLSR